MVLVLNCGSSSIKFALFNASQTPLPRTPVWSGKVEGIGTPETTCTETGQPTTTLMLDPANPYHAALAHIELRVQAQPGSDQLAAVAHRVVHGGAKYFKPVAVDAQVLADLRQLIPLAPLHQPFALETIEALLVRQPHLLQVACFDTAFHHTVRVVEQMLTLPHAAWERGLRRYGFHGLSYAYQAQALPQRYGDVARGRTLVAHLGSGASLCAMRNLQSVATTMGFSALDGLMMGTRCGSLDPGAVIYLMEIEKLSLEKVAHVLYRESGLLGVSGLSSDPRVLLAHEAENPRAQAALALYVRRIVREMGALVAVLGGLDMLIFTAGVGEHNAVIRARVMEQLGYLGVELEARANDSGGPVISSPGSRVLVGVEPANEEWVAAMAAMRLVFGEVEGGD
jgi:acetate kinase